MRLHRAVLGLSCLFGYALPGSSAQALPPEAFTVQFTNCSEFIGSGPAPLAVAQTLVAAGYTIAGASVGQAAVAVRMTGCASAQVNGTKALPTILSQIGIPVVSPDGSGFVNNYTILYVSNNPYLVRAFEKAGLPAKYDPKIAYDFTPNVAGTGGTFYGAVQQSGMPALFLYGPETLPPPNSGGLFIANWWYGVNQRIKQQTTFPNISGGTAGLSLYTSLKSPLSLLIGGNSNNGFVYYSLYNVYPSATMVVTAREH